MSLFDLFLNPEKKKGKAHLKNLLQIAMADGIMEDAEYEFLLNVGSKFNIPANEVDKMRNELSKSGSFSKEKGTSKFEQIFELIKMMMIDNNINKKELNMCKRFAKKIGFAINKVDELIDSIVLNISNGHSLEETKIRVSYLIKE